MRHTAARELREWEEVSTLPLVLCIIAGYRQFAGAAAMAAAGRGHPSARLIALRERFHSCSTAWSRCSRAWPPKASLRDQQQAGGSGGSPGAPLPRVFKISAYRVIDFKRFVSLRFRLNVMGPSCRRDGLLRTVGGHARFSRSRSCAPPSAPFLRLDAAEGARPGRPFLPLHAPPGVRPCSAWWAWSAAPQHQHSGRWAPQPTPLQGCVPRAPSAL